MQIFQWLFKVTQEETREKSSCHTNKKVTYYGKDDKTRDIILYKQRGVYRIRSKRVKESDHYHRHHCLGANYFKPFAILCRKDVAKAFFYSTLSLRRLGRRSSQRSHWGFHSMNKMKKEEIAHHSRGLSSTQKADSTVSHAAGNEVLPLSDTSTLSSSSTNPTNHQCNTFEENKKDNINNNKIRTMSRMKELLRWAAAAKSEKAGKLLSRKVLHFRNRSTLKSVPDADRLSNIESPKISFGWDVESCSTISSAYSGISMVSAADSSKINIDQVASSKIIIIT